MANILIGITGFLIIVAGVALLVILAVTTAKHNEECRRNHYGNDPVQGLKKAPRWPAVLILLGAIVICLGNCFTVVPTGYTGVRTTFGLIDQESCMPGFNFLTPFVQEISLVNNKQQDIRINDRVWSETEEQVVVYMEGTVVTYQIVPESSAWIYANVENWVEELIDADIVSSALKTASRTLKANVVTDRGVIEPLAVKTLQQAVDEKYGYDRVVIKNIIINNMDFEDSYNQAIAEKSNAMQDAERQAILNKTAIDKAIAEAEAERARARGEADAELIRAEGKANANKKIADSLSDATQLQDIIDKWNGQLPRYTSGDEGLFGVFDIEDVPQNGKQSVQTTSPASGGDQ